MLDGGVDDCMVIEDLPKLVIKPRQDHVLSGFVVRLAMGTATRDASEC
jgi:hypothetical protein